MKKQPITHLLLNTSSNDEVDNGDCDFCLVEISPGYI